MTQEHSPATSQAEPFTVEQWLELAVKGLNGIYKLFKDDGWQPDCSLLHGLSIATGQINEAVQLLKPTPEAVPFFGQPEALLEFLKSAGQGCISGHVSEWPQLRPACRWAAEQIVSARSETLCSQPPSFTKLADVHRGWCHYCDGDVEICQSAPEGGCSLRDVEREFNAAPQAAEQRGPGNNPLVIPAGAAPVSVPSAIEPKQLPECWRIRLDRDHKQAIVWHPNIGSYAASDNPDNISGTVLYWLAVALIRSGHYKEQL